MSKQPKENNIALETQQALFLPINFWGKRRIEHKNFATNINVEIYRAVLLQDKELWLSRITCLYLYQKYLYVGLEVRYREMLNQEKNNLENFSLYLSKFYFSFSYFFIDQMELVLLVNVINVKYLCLSCCFSAFLEDLKIRENLDYYCLDNH